MAESCGQISRSLCVDLTLTLTRTLTLTLTLTLTRCAALDATYVRVIDAAARAGTGPPVGPSPPRTHALKLARLWLLNLLLPFAVIWRGLATSTIVWDCNGTLKPMHPKPYSTKLLERGVRRV